MSAAAALKTLRVLVAASSLLATVLAASKATSKSYKVACTLGPAARLPSLPFDKRLKAAFAAAASLLRLTAVVPHPVASPTDVMILVILKSGYKLSKNTTAAMTTWEDAAMATDDREDAVATTREKGGGGGYGSTSRGRTVGKAREAAAAAAARASSRTKTPAVVR